jgi:hypothetical protein
MEEEDFGQEECSMVSAPPAGPTGHSRHAQVALINPGAFRDLEDLVREHTKGKGVLEIVDLQVRDLDDDEPAAGV